MAFLAALLAAALLHPGRLAAQQPETIRSVVQSLAAGAPAAGRRVAAVAQVAALYRERGFAPVWTTAAARARLREALADAFTDGLDPDVYHRRAIDSLAAQRPEPGSLAAAELDVLLTAALAELVQDLRWGRARPSSVAPAEPGADVPLLLRIVAAPDPRAELDAARPDHFVYVGLRAGLARLRALEGDGGWARVPSGPTLREGDRDARVPILRDRLTAEGYLPRSIPPSAAFDTSVARAVRSFQHHHGLNEDGAVGAATLAALNVPVTERIAQIRINLERARWITPSLPDTFIVVNVAGAKVHLVRGGKVVHEARAIVGRDYTRTPIFSALLRTIELNPYWTVPRSIVPEILAELRVNPDYLTEQGFRVLDANGQPVEPAPGELARSGPAFPWTLRQDAGPLNPLGRIKFLFPNAHDVYLHDTPARELFGQEERLFSHGCIRVQDPLALAALLLEGSGQWSREALEAAVATGALQAIPLARPVLVIVQYWTASADEQGALHFYRDVYGRDGDLLRALDDPR